jgi:molecular chaperone GrpE
MNENTEQNKTDIKNPENDVKAQGDQEITISESEHRRLVEEAASFKDKYVRILAEFDNARKRHDRERTELIKYAHEEVIMEVLGIYEDLERSLESAKKFSTDTTTIKGLELVVGKMRELLKKYDVKPIESVGKKFDPACHEAMMQEETPDHEDGTIIEEFQKGYWLGNRVARTAKVKVAKNNKP